MTNDKRQTTINPWPPQTLQRRKQRLGDGKGIMAAPIESGSNNLVVRSIGNCIMARAHWKRRQCSGFSNIVIVKQLWKQPGSGFGNNVAVALATGWRCSFANSVVVVQPC